MLRVLLAAHAFPPEEHSGAPLTTLGYATELARRGCEVSVLYPSPASGSWSRGPVRRSAEPFERIPIPREVVEHEKLESSVVAPSCPDSALVAHGLHALLDVVAPDVLHVVNNVYLPLSLPEIAHHRGVPVVRSVIGAEDLCGLGVPVSPCSGARGSCDPPWSPLKCARCVRAASPDFVRGLVVGEPSSSASSSSALEGLLRNKRGRTVHQFGSVFDAVVFPSHGSRRIFEQSLPISPSKARVIPMGMDFESWVGATSQRRRAGARAAGAPVTFVAASEKAVAKGTTDVVEAFMSRRLVSRPDWRLQFLGGGDATLVAPLADHPQVDIRGAYTAAELPDLFAGADVGLSVSRFETFHRTTREYLLAGLAVLGTRVGGIPEVVVPGFNGALVERAAPDALAAEIEKILDAPDRLALLRAGARDTAVRSVADEVDDLLRLYAEVMPSGAPER